LGKYAVVKNQTATVDVPTANRRRHGPAFV